MFWSPTSITTFQVPPSSQASEFGMPAIVINPPVTISLPDRSKRKLVGVSVFGSKSLLNLLKGDKSEFSIL